MTDIFEKVKDQVKIAEAVSLFGLQLNSRDKCHCPFHREKTPSFSVDRKNNIFTCFGCGETGDVIAFAAKMKDVEPLEGAKFLAEAFHIDIDDCPKRQSIKEYLTQCIRDVGQTDYFSRRGLTAATIKTYCLGYDVKHHSVVLPYSSELKYYQTRSIADKKFYKPTTEDAGAEPLFNRRALWGNSREPVFIVESPLCALSICQCGGSAVSLCGIGGTNKLIKEVKARKPNAPLVLCLDNDDPGLKASRGLADELTKLKVPFIVYNVAGKKKDPNELLMEDPKKLQSAITAAKKEVRKFYKRGVGSILASDLQDMHIEPPQWLIPNVLPQGLAILCASSKVGKSWMSMQMCLTITMGKNFLDYPTKKAGCLYLALEDSLYRLKDRLNKLLDGDDAPSNFYMGVTAGILDGNLIQQLDEELEEHPDIKLIIIDTLQKVRGTAKKNEIAYATDYRELSELKNYADKHKVCIFLIHHLRKMADENDVFNMISGSNGIMGVCDTIYIIYKKKRQDENATLFMTGRDIRQQDIVLYFDEDKFRWHKVGSAKEEEDKRRKRDYENNPLVITIKRLVADNPLGWKGTAGDLYKRVVDITGKAYAGSSVSLGKELKLLEDQLYADGIDHSTKRSGQNNIHTFNRKCKYGGGRQEYLFGQEPDD